VSRNIEVKDSEGFQIAATSGTGNSNLLPRWLSSRKPELTVAMSSEPVHGGLNRSDGLAIMWVAERMSGDRNPSGSVALMVWMMLV